MKGFKLLKGNICELINLSLVNGSVYGEFNKKGEFSFFINFKNPDVFVDKMVFRTKFSDNEILGDLKNIKGKVRLEKK